MELKLSVVIVLTGCLNEVPLHVPDPPHDDLDCISEDEGLDSDGLDYVPTGWDESLGALIDRTVGSFQGIIEFEEKAYPVLLEINLSEDTNLFSSPTDVTGNCVTFFHYQVDYSWEAEIFAFEGERMSGFVSPPSMEPRVLFETEVLFDKFDENFGPDRGYMYIDIAYKQTETDSFRVRFRDYYSNETEFLVCRDPVLCP